MFCNQCGHRNPEGSNFCSSCGAVLDRPGDLEPVTVTLAPVEGAGEAADEELVVSLSDVPPDAGLLVVKRGPNLGSRYLLGEGITTIGRHPDSGIFLDDVTVSRRHAEVEYHPGGDFAVRDVGSLNGTYLNRERIEAATLAHGDELQVGLFRLLFLTEASAG
ncbi:FHA domain-containing protein [Acidimicrobiaceae bacterium USS-CC1]|uniref:FHA domain-containing protein n=1 Tax=Acidiferrimicrobium australe TaxID=2664430 RepID=A0ABW9QYR5_9ACTN|nr:FHA domain-containing protein [Acidiferrimicrobium australe]